MNEIKVLDKGYIKLLDGEKEDKILKIASICYGKKMKLLMRTKKEFY